MAAGVRGSGCPGAWLTPLAVGLLLAGAWVFGEYVRARRAYLAEFERRAVLVESERLALARVAVAEERARIAREIHDVLAHSVSVMVVNAEGGRLMRHVDPAVVDRTLGVISATGREALGELRRLLEVLRTPDADASADPTTTLTTTPTPTAAPVRLPSPSRQICAG
ncbi:histidine kinase dimerization/phosphoacceptor domain-containing protein [Streptomyces mirabilis]|nr:histidine kinase dimerization/phosphoacceptor domain-containing protein [Streptomyces mirabilis]